MIKQTGARRLQKVLHKGEATQPDIRSLDARVTENAADIVVASLLMSRMAIYNMVVETFDASSDINTGTNRITLTNHTVGDTNLTAVPVKWANGGGSYPTVVGVAIDGSTVYYLKVIDGNTVEVYRDEELTIIVNFTAVGSGAAHTFTPQWVCPDDVTRIYAEAYGGGGGGGRSASAVRGGGAGGQCEGFVDVVPGMAYPLSIGVGGLGRTGSSGAGTGGGDTTAFGWTAEGGAAGSAATTKGLGGSATGAPLNRTGGHSAVFIPGSIGGCSGGSNKRATGGHGSNITPALGDGDPFGGGGGGGANIDAGDGGNGGVIILY